MSNNVTVANVPEQLPRTFLYRTDIVNIVSFVHYQYIMCSVHMYLSNMAQVEAGRETCVFSV